MKGLMLTNRQCPCGKGKLILTVEKRKHIPKGKNYSLEGDWYIYRCDKCGKGWTTTDSDERSMKNFKQRKL